MSETTPPPLSQASPAVDLPPEGEGCPPPLAWQDVLSAVRAGGRRVKIESGSVRLAATTLGTGEPLYLLPGFFGNHELSVLTSWLLRDECCCVMLDPPATLSSRRISPADRLREWSGGIVALADRLGHDRIRLHGPNFGGMIALQTMLDHPERISSASLQCAFARWNATRVERLLARLGRRSRRMLGDVRSVMRVQEANHRRWFPPFDTTRWEFYVENVAATPLADAALRAQVAGAVDFRPVLSRIESRVLIIESEGDGPIAHAAQNELSAGLQHQLTATIDNCGRLPHLTHPHRLVKQWRAFWEQTS